jgi:hypothetical protein
MPTLKVSFVVPNQIIESLKLMDCSFDNFGSISQYMSLPLILQFGRDKRFNKQVGDQLLEQMKKLQADLNQHGLALPINWAEHERIANILLTRQKAICESVCGDDRCEQQSGHKGKHNFGGHVWTTEGAAQFNKGRERLTS